MLLLGYAVRNLFSTVHIKDIRSSSQARCEQIGVLGDRMDSRRNATELEVDGRQLGSKHRKGERMRKLYLINLISSADCLSSS